MKDDLTDLDDFADWDDLTEAQKKAIRRRVFLLEQRVGVIEAKIGLDPVPEAKP